ncbi:MAG: hypothetical protein F6K24_21475 [Okeania sp. SIO2D1]|nr:hypothetical protein [Okeania sp. SIO2D1]
MWGVWGVWGVWEKLKNIYPHHYHAGLPKNQINYHTEFINSFPLLPTASFLE